MNERPKFGACRWRDDCPSVAIYSHKGGGAARCSYHRDVDDASIRPYFVQWFHVRPPCGECGAVAKFKSRRAGVLHYRCEAHRLPALEVTHAPK